MDPAVDPRSKARFWFVRCPRRTAREIVFEPGLPESQHDAIAQPAIRRGDAAAAAVRSTVLEQRRPAARLRQLLPTGVDVGRQRGAARRRGHPELLAGGGASSELQAIVATRRDGRRDPRARHGWASRRRCSRRARSSGTRIRGRAAATRSSTRRSIRSGAPGSRDPPAGSSSPASTPASSGRAT